MSSHLRLVQPTGLAVIGVAIGRNPLARSNPNALGKQLIAEYKAKQKAALSQGGPISDGHFLARAEGTQRSAEIVRTFTDRQMAGMYLCIYKAVALAKWREGCDKEPGNVFRWPEVERFLRDATEGPLIV